MSLSIISAAATKRRMAASPLVSEPLLGCAKAGTLFPRSAAPAVAAAPATTLFFRNERRFDCLTGVVSVEDWSASGIESVTSLLIVHTPNYSVEFREICRSRVTVEGKSNATSGGACHGKVGGLSKVGRGGGQETVQVILGVQTVAELRRRRRKSSASRWVPFIGMLEATVNTTSSRTAPCCQSASRPCRYSDRNCVCRNQTAGRFADGLQHGRSSQC